MTVLGQLCYRIWTFLVYLSCPNSNQKKRQKQYTQAYFCQLDREQSLWSLFYFFLSNLLAEGGGGTHES